MLYRNIIDSKCHGDIMRDIYPVYLKFLERQEFGEEYEDYFLDVSIMGFHSRVIGMDSRIPSAVTINNLYTTHLFTDKHIFMLDTIPMNEIEYSHFRARAYNMSVLEGCLVVIAKSSQKTPDIAGYHLIIPQEFTEHDVQHITFAFKEYADMLFYGLGQKRGFWDLRISSKGKGTGESPEAIDIFFPRPQYGSVFKRMRPISEAHWKVMQTYLNLGDIPDKLPRIRNGNKVNEILMRYSV
jgi:hypothetical protein